MAPDTETTSGPIAAPRRRSVIQRRLLTWGLSLLTGVTLVVSIAGYSYVEKVIRRDAAALQSELAATTAERIREFVRRKIDRFADNAKVLSLHPLGGDDQRLLLGLLVKNDSSFSHAALINAEGMEIIKVSDRKVYFPSDLTDQTKSIHFIAALKGETYISPVYSSAESQPYVTLAIPLWGPGQSVIGVVSAEADLSFLWEAIGKIQFATAGYAYLVEAHGMLIAHKDANVMSKHKDLRQLDGVKKFLNNPKRRDPVPAYEGRGLFDVPVLATYAPVPEFGWAVILEEPAHAALAAVTMLRLTAIIFFLVALVVGTAVIFAVSRRITKPIEELRADVALIGAGNLDHRAEIQTGDEIEELGAEFNKMTEALQNSHATLEQKVEQRTNELSTLYGITAAVNESLNLSDILNAVVAKITETFHFVETRIYIFDDRMESVEFSAGREIAAGFRDRIHRTKLGEGIVGHVMKCGEPLIFEDVQNDPRYAALSQTKTAERSRKGFFAVYPIKTQTRVYGVMMFNAKSSRSVTSTESQLLTSISEHLGLATEKATLFRQAETRARQLATLNTIGDVVNRSLNLDEVLTQAVAKMVETLSFDAAWIYILDDSQDQLVLKASIGLEEATIQKIRQRPPTEGVNGKVFTTGSHLIFEDYRSDDGDTRLASHGTFRALGFASTASFAIKAKDKVIGVLHLANHAKRHLAADELRLIESITQTIGVGVEKSHLLEQTGQDLQRRQILHEVNLAVTSTLELDEIGPKLLAALTKRLPYAYTLALRLFDSSTGRLLRVAGTNTDSKALEMFDALAQRAVDDRDAVVIENLAADPSVPQRESFAGEDQRSLLCVPLMMGSECLGVLSLTSRTMLEFRSQEVELLQTVANQAAMGIYNAQLYRDIVAQKEAIEKAKEAEAAAAVKARFFAMMSHEIRTPLNAVIGLTDLLLHSKLDDDQRNMVDTVKQSGSSLLAVINDILDFSKIDADKVVIEQADIEIDRLMTGVVDILSLQAKQKGLELISTVDPAVPRFFVGDAARIRQILFNLVGNAVKFTGAGTISVNLTVAEENDRGLLLRFAVKDPGIGISAAAQARLFQPFSQADSSTTRKYGGTGLGLAICKKLAEHMGGQMGLESAEGKGSLFWFSVFGQRAEQQTAIADNNLVTAHPSARAGQARILLVEDNPVNQMVALRLLKMLGYEADTAGDGAEAVAALEQVAYDLLLMDCEMPNMDGYQATALIRQMETQSGRRHRIVAMTANAMDGDREKCLNAGMDDYLAKPIQLETLQTTLER